jgi:hypothetical protein
MSDHSAREGREEHEVAGAESNSPLLKRRKREVFGSDEGIVEKTLEGEYSRCN